MGLFGHGGGLSKLNKHINNRKGWATIGLIGAGVATGGLLLGAGGVAGGLGAAVYGGAGAAGLGLGSGTALALGAMTGVSAYSAITTAKAQRESLQIQRDALNQQAEELERQRNREIAQQKRENEQLMSSVSGLTDTSYGGVSSPSLSYDKYGDLG